MTDIHGELTLIYSNGERNVIPKNEFGTHLGMVGVSIGYANTPERGFGFSSGAQLLQTFNQSEYGEDKLNLLIPEFNLTLAANRYWNFFTGVNVSIWNGSDILDNNSAKFGGQVGAALRFNSNLVLNAGYYITNVNPRSAVAFFDVDGNYQISGLNSSLIYVF